VHFAIALIMLVLGRFEAPRSAVDPSLPARERANTNDNRTAAGTLANGVLTIRLEAREAMWHPDEDTAVGIPVFVFAEEGKTALNPGPLIRVREGTSIRASVRNTLSSPLIVHGLYARGTAPRADTIHVAPGATRTVQFDAGQRGTYYYWASTTEVPTIARSRQESQLSGAFVIDAPDAPAAPNERIFLISSWADSLDAATAANRIVINGKSWPHTERLSYDEGESIRWRVINANAPVHPMHLHGFYYRVHSRGGESVDTIIPDNAPAHMVVTERLGPGRTMSMSFTPDRGGNWIFHCHDNVHLEYGGPLPGAPPRPAAHHAMNHALESMSGPVIGMYVRPKVAAQPVSESARRRLRLLVRQDTGSTQAEPAFGYVLDDGSPKPSPLLPGSTIVLRRGEPVGINVVNQLNEPTAVHWHGIELESYYDGVAGYGGMPGRISPPIAARDSFAAYMTPPRAGTFIYHAHLDEVRQQRAGLSGALLVIEPGATYDPDTDIALLISTPRTQAAANFVLLNGSTAPPVKQMRVGTRYRLRLINIHTSRPSMIASLLDASGGQLSWRPVAKDGYDLDAVRTVSRPAIQQMGNGETYDFEFIPTSPGDLKLEIRAQAGALLVTWPIQVRQDQR
jgi:FtsP/CotA-like multicopper oxidase with cupredoxin domain